MKPLAFLGLGLGAILAYGYFKGGTTLQALSFKMLDGVKYVPQNGLAANLAQQKIAVDATINNPGGAIQFQSFKGSAYFDGKVVVYMSKIQSKSESQLRTWDQTDRASCCLYVKDTIF